MELLYILLMDIPGIIKPFKDVHDKITYVIAAMAVKMVR